MRVAASRGLFGASLGALSYVSYRGGLRELREAQDKPLRELRVTDAAKVAGVMEKYGACVLEEAVPVHGTQLKPTDSFSDVLEGITFRGRPLLGPSKTVNLDVAGAAIGSALAMPLLIPGSFLAGALLGHSSGYVISMLQSMKQPSVRALLDVACSRIRETDPGFEASSDGDGSSASGAGASRLGSVLSLMLFGPLALKREERGELSSSGCACAWQSWCFHDAQAVTEEGVMPEVAQLMQEVHAASWQQRSESSELLGTDATWRFPDLVMNLAILRSAEKLWQRALVEQQVLQRGWLVWADGHPQQSFYQPAAHWWAGDATGFCRGAYARGLTALVPLVDMRGSESETPHLGATGVQLELFLNSHREAEAELVRLPLRAGDVIFMDHGLWRSLRLPAGSAERALFLAYEYADGTQELPTAGVQDVAFWSAAAWLARLQKDLLLAGEHLRGKLGLE